jgi:hypothetical protein
MDKICSRCKLTKDINLFSLNKTTKDGHRCQCKECIKIYSGVYEKTMRKRIHSRDKVNYHNNLRKYKITYETYKQMFYTQNGRCAICNRHQDSFKRLLSVDHNHVTQKVRSLLCDNCNSILGHSKENIEILNKVIDYLKIHNK